MIITKFTMDLISRGITQKVDAVQNDASTRGVALTLTSGNTPWAVPSGITAAVAFRKERDGKKGLYDQLPDGSTAVTVSGSTVTAIFAPQMLTVPGKVFASVVLLDADLNRLATFPFVVMVAEDPSAGQEVSNDYYRYSTMAAVSAAVDAWLTETAQVQQTFLKTASDAMTELRAVVDDGQDAPPILCQSSGTVISVSDSGDRLLRGLTLYGRTTQDGTPSPDAPAELVSLGAAGEITVTAAGKNLIPAYKTTQISGVKFTVNTDGSVTASGDATAESDAPAIYSSVWLEPGTYTVSGAPEGSTVGSCDILVWTENGTIGRAYTGSTNSTFTVTKRVLVSVGVRFTTRDNITRTYYPQIEAGEAATAYEPYKAAQTLTISTPNGLPGIPVSGGGNYTDESGQRWICDEIDLARGVYVQRIGQIYLDGTTAPYEVVARTNSVRVVYGGFANASNSVTAQRCNRLTLGGAYTQDVIAFVMSSDNTRSFVMGLPLDAGTTKDSVKAWLAANPIQVMYILETPVETALDAETIAAFAAVHTYKPNTTVCNSAGAYQTVEYVADTKLYIDNKLGGKENV